MRPTEAAIESATRVKCVRHWRPSRRIGQLEIVGILTGLLVFASWDGCVLTVSEELYEDSLFSLALERLFAAPDRAEHASHVLDNPQRIAIRLLQSLDHLVRIEYGNWCDRSRRKCTWLLEGAHKARPSRLSAH